METQKTATVISISQKCADLIAQVVWTQLRNWSQLGKQCYTSSLRVSYHPLLAESELSRSRLQTASQFSNFTGQPMVHLKQKLL